MSKQLSTPDGWNGAIVSDPDATHYLLLSNFASDQKCTIENAWTYMGNPVFTTETTIGEQGSTATFIAEENHSVINTLKIFIIGQGVTAIQDANDSTAIYVRNDIKGKNTIKVNGVDEGQTINKEIELSNKVIKISIRGGELLVEEAAGFPETAEAEDLTKGYKDITEEKLVNASFETDETYGKADGNVTLGSVTYNPCYVNTVNAVNSKWPNILPVNGWTAGNTLSSASNFCRMYSMPYSTTQFCVSPANVGNYSARCPRPLFDETCGTRVMTVLNSWSAGSNAITQKVTLPEGSYRLLMDVRCECTNMTSNNGKVITTSGNNTCTSLTGIKIGSTTDYRYPTEKNTWQQLCYDFELTTEQTITISLGYRSSASAGAANNTLLYIDHLQLLVADDNTTFIKEVEKREITISPKIYDLQGRQINNTNIHRGLYIQSGHKFLKE
jgi:hypothetical protein